MKRSFAHALMISVFAFPFMAHAQDDIGNLDNLSLENLGNVVTSVSKKPEDSFRSAAAIYVITNEDIKLSGATHVAEALRGVPGLDVARFDSSNWAISSRGFNGFFANKLLVLVDGRTIYTPLFSGVYWDIQNLPLEDIDRIEVIRGPGASLYGANAVNGVINIITKSAMDTQGTYLNALAGNQDKLSTEGRYGGKTANDVYYRTYAKYDMRDSTVATTGADGHNEWQNAKAGFRSDWTSSPTRKFTVQGDVYTANIDLDLSVPSLTGPGGLDSYHDTIHSKGFNILGKWDEKHDDNMQSTFQSYIDFQSPNYSSLEQEIATFDVDYQTSWKTNDRNDLIWGAGVRYIYADLTGSSTIGVIGNSTKTQNIISTFVQDQYAVIPKEIYLTLGTKLEHNSYSGFELEPSARIAWYPDSKQTLWASISHAVRTPSISEHTSMTLNALAIPPNMLQQRSSSSFQSEELTAYEVGYRIKPVSNLTFDNTAFMNDYDKLSTLEPGDPIGIILPYYFSNLGKGKAYGFETSATWDVTSRWSLLANYSYINLLLEQDPSSGDFLFLTQRGQVPHNQFMLRSQLFLPHDVRLINTGYYVDDLPSAGIGDYLRFDTQVIWQPMKGLELAVVGQNLLDNRHPEFSAPPDGTANEIPRSVYGRVSVRY